MINKYLITLTIVVGFLIGNPYVAASVIPALIVNFIMFVTIQYANQSYSQLMRSTLLARDIKTLNNNIFMNILVLVARASLFASSLYILYTLFNKYYGVIQL